MFFIFCLALILWNSKSFKVFQIKQVTLKPTFGTKKLFNHRQITIYSFDKLQLKLIGLVFSCSIALFNFPISSIADMIDNLDKVDAAKVSRSDVGLIDLNTEEPTITDICWLDVKAGEASLPQRIEISLYGKTV
jgi:hypothetical protein